MLTLRRLGKFCGVPNAFSRRQQPLAKPFRVKLGSRWHACATDGRLLVLARTPLARELPTLEIGLGEEMTEWLRTRPREYSVSYAALRRFAGKPVTIAAHRALLPPQPADDCLLYGAPFDRRRLAFALRAFAPGTLRLSLHERPPGYCLRIRQGDCAALLMGLNRHSGTDRVWPVPDPPEAA
jgi:hypothetical protein